jgi:hypothetical protein
MKSTHKRVVCGFVGSICCLIAGATGQSNADAQRAVVVRLHTHFATHKKDETAAGLFVGKDQQYAYFITARHAVVDEIGNQEVHAQSTELWFHDSPQPIKAQVFDHTDAILDLGVVFAPAADLPPNLPQIVRKDAAVNAPVIVIGHPAAGDWSMWQGTVQNENAPNGDVHHFITSTNQSLTHGYSGGPVFDSNGFFYGMHVATESSYGIAAKAAEIVAQLGAWRVPTNDFLEGPSVSDTDAIKQIVHQYEEAYNHRDANALWNIWPMAPANTKHSIEAAFQTAASIKMSVDSGTPDIKADNASLKGQFTQIFTPRNTSTQLPRSGDIKFSFKKNDGAWTIVDVQ